VSVVRHSATIFLLGWLTAPISFVTSAIVARTVGPEGKGVLFLLAGLTAIMTALTNPGATSAATVLYKQKRQPLGAIVAGSLIIFAASLLLLVGVYLLFSATFVRIFLGDITSAHPQRGWVALALAPVFPSQVLTVAEILFIADGAMALYAAQKCLMAFLTLGLTWLLSVRLGWGIAGVLWAQLLSNGLALSVFLYWLTRKGLLRQIRFSSAATRELLSVGLQQYWVSLVALISKRLDAFLVVGLLSVRDAGFYSVASSIQSILLTIPRATAWPLISQFSGTGGQEAAIVARTSRIQLLFLALATAAMFPLAGLGVRLLFGAAFLPAVTPVRWALLGVPWMGPTMAAATYFVALRQPGRSIIPTAFGALAQLGVFLVLAGPLGVVGAALASSAQLFVTAIVQLLFIRRLERLSLRDLIVPTADDLRVMARAVRGLLRRGGQKGG
jgi:O-antigen/teichoic acid export membrane protein